MTAAPGAAAPAGALFGAPVMMSAVYGWPDGTHRLRGALSGDLRR